MRLSMIAISSVSILATLSVAQAHELSADRCQPLTDSNRVLCCSAANWKDVVLPNEQLSCAQSGNQVDKSLQAPGDTTGSITSPPDDGGGTTTPGSGGVSGEQSGAANPGNDNDVGGAGEKGMNNETPSTGTQGNSN